ncbi:hypothetical protein LOZ53_004416 [Ophidiomyces ophidiicola]|nr:hypothetical protein LOZ53_004416 [Ophidiomyces ophidiicola]
MATLTCPDNDKHRHDSGSTLTDISVTSPFLRVSPTPQHDGPASPKFDIALSSLRVVARSISSLSFVSDSKSFCTALTVTDIDVKATQPRSPPDPKPPQQSSVEDRMVNGNKIQGMAGGSGQRSQSTNDASLPALQTSLEEQVNSNTAQQESPSPKARRRKSQTPTTSRSSSISGSKSTRNSSRASPYHQFQLQRNAVSEYPSRSYREDRDLITLHRESCRLFQSFSHPTKHNPALSLDTMQEPGIRPTRASTEPSHSSNITRSKIITRRSSADLPSNYTHLHSQLDRGAILPAHSETVSLDLEGPDSPLAATRSQDSDGQQIPERIPAYKRIPPTVIDWTSPSTRKREYEKIDRSSRGIRGMWRRLAPKWCQSKSQRLSFFNDTTKDKRLYESSVRRFRMDIPTDNSEKAQ